MKFCFLLLLLCLPYTSYSQTMSGIRRVTTGPGERANVPEPSPSSQRYKFKCEMARDVFFAIYASEFNNGKKVYDQFERVCSRSFKSGNRFSWEVVPDLSNRQYLQLFMFFPGMSATRVKITTVDKCFKYFLYEDIQNKDTDNEVSLIFIYEDEIANSPVEKELLPFLTQEQKIPTQNDSIIRSKTERFILVHYNLKDI